MTNHYVATVPVKHTDGEGTERTRFQRVGAMSRNTRSGDGSPSGGPISVPEIATCPVETPAFGSGHGCR